MEKKNTILLTVIAIATLLVAVVGATFAYFTATVTTTNDENNTIEAKTYALPTVQMNYGNKITSGEGIYPGTTIVKDVSISATCPTGDVQCSPVDTTLTITTADPDDVFGSDIKWTLYKMSSKTDEVTCTVTPNVEGGHYYSTTECTGLTNGTVVDSSTGKGTKTIDIKVYGVDKTDATVNEAHDDKYYLVVEYINRQDTGEGENVVSGNQDVQQGKNFSVEMVFAAK